MALRSWLMVPADSEVKLAKSLSAGADAVVLDLEDAVAPEGKQAARGLAQEWLIAHRQQVVASRKFVRWVRINGLDSRLWRDDLLAVMPGTPEGIILPKAAGPEAVRQLAAELYEIEQRSQIAPNTTKVIAMAGETAASALNIATYAEASLPRLGGLTWGANDLAAAIGATRRRDAAGDWTGAFAQVRTQVLLAAQARGVFALETVYLEARDGEGLRKAAQAARADGFTGMLANHPAQVPVINAAFTPSEEELARARAIVASFQADPTAGGQSHDRRMIEVPDLMHARRMLGLED